MKKFFSQGTRLNSRHLSVDAVITVFSFYFSLYLRVGGTESYEGHFRDLTRLIPIFLLVRLATFVATGIYDIIWRYISFQDSLKLFRGVLLSTVFIVAATYLVDIGRVPRSVFFIDCVVSTVLFAGIRIGRRSVYENSQIKIRRNNDRRRVLIFGAGNNGRLLASRLQTDQIVGFNVVGFIDDDAGKQSRKIGGVKVLGRLDEMENLIPAYGVQEVIVAISGANSDLLRKVFEKTRGFGIRPRLITGLVNVPDGKPAFELYRNIQLSDLLSRPPKSLDLSAVQNLIKNHRVLITGAGGSIGSELARQVFRFGPSRLVLLDHSEYNLYKIDHELRLDENQNDRVAPVLADIKDKHALRDVFVKHTPDFIFHAAAYKHVHLVEANPYSAILNNIEGTKNLVDLSREFDVQHFVQISTDKAVNPVGVMGATKRACELLVTEAGKESGRHYCSVRFGNVLGSSGSLIPLLQKQIRDGEPITITHKDITRYFMLIPEAVSLVLTASSLTNNGDVAILRMGEPIKILDIAKSLIALMGKQEGDVPIVFTGLRPGEKMYEELCLSGKEVESIHPDIMLLPGGDADDWESGRSVYTQVESIISSAKEYKADSLFALNRLVGASARPQTADINQSLRVVQLRDQ